jgi:glycine/D-amino acid oxidase-like deaminating enzyme
MGSTMLQSAPNADATWRRIAATKAALPALNGDVQTDVATIEISERWSGMIAVVPSNFPCNGTFSDGIFYAFGSDGRDVALSSYKMHLLAAWRCGEQTGPGPMGSTGLKPIPFYSWRIPGPQP